MNRPTFIMVFSSIRCTQVILDAPSENLQQHRPLVPQMRHHLGGEEIHVPPRQCVREDAELE
jgi:hypothetical protein